MRFSPLWILPLLAPPALAQENLYPAPRFEESGVVAAAHSGQRAGHLRVDAEQHWAASASTIRVMDAETDHGVMMASLARNSRVPVHRKLDVVPAHDISLKNPADPKNHEAWPPGIFHGSLDTPATLGSPLLFCCAVYAASGYDGRRVP